jgi:hypothetical protein
MILNSIARDEEPEESNALVVETSVSAVKPIIHSNLNSVKKVVIVKAPVVTKEAKKTTKSLPKVEKKVDKKTSDKSKVNKVVKPKELKPKVKPTTNIDY